MSARSGFPGAGAGSVAGESRRWWILAAVCVAYLMIILDLTVMNLALPSAQHALKFSNADRQWVVTAYALAFGSLMLFCGRLADLTGRKVTFLAGLAGFAAASAVGGASVSFAMLVTARACQGVFAALLAPSAMSLVATTFTGADQKARAKAFGLFSAAAGSGGGLGLLIGGALTTYLSWRWCLYVNLVFAGCAFAAGAVLLGRQPRTAGARLDVPGVVAVSGGMLCLVYGFSNAATHSWGTPSTWAFLAAGAALLIVFAAWQSRAADPLLPPRVVLDRNRGGAYLTMIVIGGGNFSVFLFLIYYLQLTLGYSAIKSGFALLPMIGTTVVTASVGQAALMPRFGPKPLVATGLLASAASMAWLTGIGPHTGYASAVLGPVMLIGAGMGLVYAMGFNTGTSGVAPRDAGVASASIATGQQLGGAIGIALLNTIAANATASYLASRRHGRPVPDLTQLALVHGYITVFWCCAGLFAGGAVIFGALLRRGPLARPKDAPAPGPSRQAATTPS
jgi:EmrB/QacA subfamily drug resistance transporter